MIALGDDVSAALDGGQPVVALESTIFSQLGLPSPHNREAYDRCVAAVEHGGAVPALTCVLNGIARVGGITAADLDRVLSGERKVASRDLAVAIGQGWGVGVTTVSASLSLAAKAGIEVFATGGIGGVHREVGETHDVSADLPALATNPVVAVSAGAKAFLDLGRTAEYLETAAVPVLGWRTDEFPAFYSPRSGVPVAHTVESAEEVAAIARAHWALNPGAGLLVAAPIPPEAALDPDRLDAALETALATANAAGIRGAALTPYILSRIGEATAGDNIAANLALAEHNASVAADIATALAQTPT